MTEEQPSVEQYFEQVGYGHPIAVPFKKFESILSLYEDKFGKVVDMLDEERNEIVKVCPVTGEEIRRYSTKPYDLITKNVEDIEMYEQVEEILSVDTRKVTITEELLAMLHKAQSEALHSLLTSVFQSNQGCVDLSKVDKRRFKDSVKHLEEMLIVVPVKNKLRKGNYYSYRIAPYLAYKGSVSAQDSAIEYWMRYQAQEQVKRINKNGGDFPVTPFKK